MIDPRPGGSAFCSLCSLYSRANKSVFVTYWVPFTTRRAAFGISGFYFKGSAFLFQCLSPSPY
jgi:hypothetical protein